MTPQGSLSEFDNSYCAVNIQNVIDIDIYLLLFLENDDIDEPQTSSDSDTMKRLRLKYRKMWAQNKKLNKKRKTRNEIVEEKKTKRNLREAKLKLDLEKEEENVRIEKEKLAKQKKLYKNECAVSSLLRAQLKKATSEDRKKQIGKEAVKFFVEKNFKGHAQRKMLLNPGQKWARNSRDDIIEALAIKSYSPRTFEYLQKNGSLYLPSRRTIERHIDNIATCKTG